VLDIPPSPQLQNVPVAQMVVEELVAVRNVAQQSATPNFLPAHVEECKNTLNAEGNVAQLSAVQHHPVRRGRGHPPSPRGRGLPALEAGDNVQVQDNQGVRRKRRRGRGCLPPAYVVNSNSESSEEDHDHPEFDAFFATQNRVFLQRRANIMERYR
jgi:hypothetical protein